MQLLLLLATLGIIKKILLLEINPVLKEEFSDQHFLEPIMMKNQEMMKSLKFLISEKLLEENMAHMKN
jgi:hypothetical protein